MTLETIKLLDFNSGEGDNSQFISTIINLRRLQYKPLLRKLREILEKINELKQVTDIYPKKELEKIIKDIINSEEEELEKIIINKFKSIAAIDRSKIEEILKSLPEPQKRKKKTSKKSSPKPPKPPKGNICIIM